MTPAAVSPAAVSLARELASPIAARAAAADQAGRLPAEDVQALRASGYLALSVPEEYGGAGCTLSDCVAAQLELAQGSAATALVAAMPLQVIGNAAQTRSWPEDGFGRICELALKGGLVNAAASEPALGSPSRGGLPQTELSPRGDGYALSGHKTWTTGGTHLTHLLVQARLGDDAVTVLVENHAPGVRWEESWDEALSLRASDSHDVFFDNVSVQPKALLRQTQEARTPNAWFPMLVAATYLGTGLAARAAIVRYALERVPTALGKAIATLPNIQRQLGEIEVALEAAKTFLLETAGEWSASPGDYARVVAAKHLATETAIMATDKALRIAGGASLSRTLPFERYFRDARAGITHPPSGDLALELVGRELVARAADAP